MGLMKIIIFVVLSMFSFTSFASVRLYKLDCGQIDFKDLSFFSDTGDFDGKSGKMVVSCYLIKHPKGILMWDTGLTENLIGKPATNVIGATESVQLKLEEQLKAIGLGFKDITHVSFSHFHADHAGNANLFKDSTWILQKKELNFIKGSPIGVIPELFSKISEVARIEVDGDYDVFGDGSVKLLFAPGHTPGHQVLALELKRGNYLLAGDLYHLEHSREKKLVPVFNPSRAETLASIDRVEKYAKVKKAKVIIQHGPVSSLQVPALPKYLD